MLVTAIKYIIIVFMDMVFVVLTFCEQHGVQKNAIVFQK